MEKYFIQMQRRLIKTVILMSLSLIAFSALDASAEKIHCDENVDMEKYPICAYETEWNESEKFNEKVIEELATHQQEINEDPDRFAEIYIDVYNKVDQENEGLKEKGEDLKKWIYEQLEK